MFWSNSFNASPCVAPIARCHCFEILMCFEKSNWRHEFSENKCFEPLLPLMGSDTCGCCACENTEAQVGAGADGF